MGSMAKIGPCGGSAGTYRSMDMRGVNRIVMIVVNHGMAIDSMSVLYERDGLEESTEKWGGDGGGRSEVRLGSEEYLTSVKGHVSLFWNFTVVRSLTFTSNYRQFGPFGEEEGAPFNLPATCGEIIGFHARSGALLDAIGIYVKTD